MRVLFQSFDAQRFAVVNCATCHGEGAENRTFGMPNAGIAQLPDNAAGFQAFGRDKPEWMRFMAQQVRPRMAALLGMEELDMRNPKPGRLRLPKLPRADQPGAPGWRHRRKRLRLDNLQNRMNIQTG
jgi:hypothetical protein